MICWPHFQQQYEASYGHLEHLGITEVDHGTNWVQPGPKFAIYNTQNSFKLNNTNLGLKISKSRTKIKTQMATDPLLMPEDGGLA